MNSSKRSIKKNLDTKKRWLAATASAAALSAGFTQLITPAKASPYTLEYQGYTYSLDASTDDYTGAGVQRILSTSWYGDSGLAEGLAKATELNLGSAFDPRGYNGVLYGRYFYTYFEPGQGINILDQVRASACQYLVYSYSGTTLPTTECKQNYNRFDLDGAHYGYAYEASPRVKIGAPVDVLATGNLIGGSGINITSNLPSQGGTKLLPQFQGGTLSVSTASTITDNFTLNSSQGNSIDSAGKSATFAGFFGDEAGQQGTISFVNSAGSAGARIALSGKSTYSGGTSIWDNATIDIGTSNALPSSTDLSLYGNGTVRLNDNNQSIASLGGAGYLELGSGSLSVGSNYLFAANSSADISGTGGLIKDGQFIQRLSGKLSFTGPTTIKAGALVLNGSSTSDANVLAGATLGGSGTITGNVVNSGTLSPGNSIGTFTINDGSYTQTTTGVLALEVDGTTSDLLKLTGSAFVTDLAGTVKISGTPTAGLVYTGIEGLTDYQGTSTANANTSSVVIAAGYQFCRQDDECFKQLTGNPDPDASRLQFAWAPLSTNGEKLPIATTPEKAIDQAIQKGGPITRVVRGSTSSEPPTPTPGNPNTTLVQTCISNTADPNGCAAAIQAPPVQPPNQNINSVAPQLDGGNAAIATVVTQGVTGGAPIPSSNGGNTGYTTQQAQAAGLPSDFVTVLSAVNALPTRSALISSLHQVTAEPYASMQSVALEALEQFRQNSLALSDGNRAIRLFTEAEMCLLDDGTVVPKTNGKKPSNCKPRTLSQASRWSLLIDATNTQANLDGTNDLASLDYNIFQSSYGLQYDASKQWSIGGSFGYGQANLYNYQYANSTINSDTYGGSLWGVYRPSSAWKITGLVGYTNFQYDSNRTMSFGGLNRTASAEWSGNGFTTALEARYDWILSANKADRNAIRLKPNTYFGYSLHNQGAITETGAQSLNLAIDGHTADSLVYGIGFTLETPIQVAKTSRLIPRLTVGYEYDFNANTDQEHQVTASFAEVPALGSIDVLGQNRGANDLNVALNLELETSEQFSLYAGAGGSFWSNGNELTYGGGIRWRFGGAPKATKAKPQTLASAR